MFIDEISNIKLRKMVQAGELDDPRHVTRIFKHYYSGRNVDWGYIDKHGDCYAFFGGDTEEFASNKVDLGEDFKGLHVDDLEIFDEWMLTDIEHPVGDND